MRTAGTFSHCIKHISRILDSIKGLSRRITSARSVDLGGDPELDRNVSGVNTKNNLNIGLSDFVKP